MDPQIIDGRYQVIRELGKGGMGVVYEAKNIETSRRVAVKVIASSLLAKGSDATARFKREAKAAGAIETQHIAQVLDAGRDATTGDPYIVMELLVGEDLRQLVDRLGPLPPDLALRITAQACVGLHAAHQSGIIHRDIKSANLVLARREGGEMAVKIVDFGIAKVVVDNASPGQSTELTHTGSVLGSPRYLSPEQGKGQRDVTPRSDLWSLGVVLYEMLAGATPHAEIEGIFAVVMAICSQPTPPIQQRAPWVPAEVAAIVHRALQIDPQKRFASAAEMGDALRALLPGGTSIHESMLAPLSEEVKLRAAAPFVADSDAGQASSSADGASSTETGLNVTQTAEATSLRAKRSRLVALGAAALVIGVGAGIGLTLKLRGGGPADAPRAESSAESSPSAPTPSTSQAAPSPAGESTLVRVMIEPSDALVELDGRPASVSKDGGIALSGPIGSVHRVRVALDGRETVADVAVTLSGPMPSAVRLAPPPPKSLQKPQADGASIKASVAPSAAPVAPLPPPPKRTSDPPPATKFE